MKKAFSTPGWAVPRGMQFVEEGLGVNPAGTAEQASCTRSAAEDDQDRANHPLHEDGFEVVS